MTKLQRALSRGGFTAKSLNDDRSSVAIGKSPCGATSQISPLEDVNRSRRHRPGPSSPSQGFCRVGARPPRLPALLAARRGLYGAKKLTGMNRRIEPQFTKKRTCVIIAARRLPAALLFASFIRYPISPGRSRASWPAARPHGRPIGRAASLARARKPTSKLS